MGCYHGKFSFDQLSHLRSCLIKQLKMEGVNSMRYPPHTPKKLGWARFFILKTVDLGWVGRMALLAVLAVVAAVVLQVSHRGGEECWFHMWHYAECRNMTESKQRKKEMTLITDDLLTGVYVFFFFFFRIISFEDVLLLSRQQIGCFLDHLDQREERPFQLQVFA